MKRGKVYLVGAGPGDPELLTLKAVRVLGEADVVLHDDLVAGEVLEHVRAGARIVPVGKRGGCESTPQEFIERLMVAEASRGNVVVRLKGGDPMIFGRGGEECEALRAHGIEHEVVNGITSGLAAATAAGIPLTHRAHAPGVILVTGHEHTTVDWEALAATRLPLVIYMGMSRLASLQATLLGSGFRDTTPVCLVGSASRAEERRVATRLSRMAVAAAAASIASPAIVFVGTIAGLALDAVLSDAATRTRVGGEGAADRAGR